MRARPQRYVASPHQSRNAAQERQRAIFRVLAAEPDRAFTLLEIYAALRYALTRAEIKSAISCLRTRGLIKLNPGDSHDRPGTYQLAELGLLELGALG
jgi:hypothetical protein